MLKEYCGFKKTYIACGYTDLRNGIDGLASIIQNHFSLDPFEEGTLFLFCGRKTNRMKGLLWEADGFVLCINDWRKEDSNGPERQKT